MKCKCQEYVNRISEGVYDVFGKRVFIRVSTTVSLCVCACACACVCVCVCVGFLFVFLGVGGCDGGGCVTIRLSAYCCANLQDK
jgi:hypothetical protein